MLKIQCSLLFFFQAFRLGVRPPLVRNAPLQSPQEAAIKVSHKEIGDVLDHVVEGKTVRLLAVSDNTIPDMSRGEVLRSQLAPILQT